MDPVVHFELPYENAERISNFYRKAFGWRTRALGEEMGNYILATTADTDVRPGVPAGAIDGGFYPKKPDWPSQYPSIVIAVGDIAGAMAAVESAGGSLLGEPIRIPGVGLYMSFLDTEGNRASMLQAEPEADD